MAVRKTAPRRPLGKELYAAAVDSCGGKVLANVLTQVSQVYFQVDVWNYDSLIDALSSVQIKHSGVVAACGLAAGMPLSTTVSSHPLLPSCFPAPPS